METNQELNQIEIRQATVERRVDKIESNSTNLSDSINKLVIEVTKLSLVIEKLNNLEPRVTKLESERIPKLELEITNNKIITNMIKWLGIALGGSAISVALSSMASNLFGS